MKMSSQPKDASAAFILVCPEKSIRETGDGKLERAFQSLALKQHLDALRVGLPESQVAYLPGAGVAYTEGCAKAVVENRWLAVFAGYAGLLSVCLTACPNLYLVACICVFYRLATRRAYPCFLGAIFALC